MDFSVLPPELILHVLSFLPGVDLARCERVCSLFRQLICFGQHPADVVESLWDGLALAEWGAYFPDRTSKEVCALLHKVANLQTGFLSHPEWLAPDLFRLADGPRLHIHGDSGCGKTQLMHNYTRGRAASSSAQKYLFYPTEGFKLRFSKTILDTNQGPSKIRVYDHAGDPQLKAERTVFTTNIYAYPCGVMFVWDVSRPETLVDLLKWRFELKLCLKGIVQVPNPVFLLVGNKMDLIKQDPERVQQQYDLGREMARNLEAPLIFTSMQDPEHAKLPFHLLSFLTTLT